MDGWMQATLISIALWALIPGFIAWYKGRNFIGYYFLSFVVSPVISTLIILCMSNKNKEAEKKYWDEHPDSPLNPNNKKYSESDKLNVPEDNQTNTKRKKVKKTKITFCKKCGHMIDPETKKCTGCGKQYFKIKPINKNICVISCLAIFLLSSVTYNIFLLYDRQQNAEMIDEMNKQMGIYRNTILQLDEANRYQSTQMDEFMDLWDTSEFLRDNAAVIPNDGSNLFHRYWCDKLDLSSGYWILNREFAVGEGYEQCPDCEHNEFNGIL